MEEAVDLKGIAPRPNIEASAWRIAAESFAICRVSPALYGDKVEAMEEAELSKSCAPRRRCRSVAQCVGHVAEN